MTRHAWQQTCMHVWGCLYPSYYTLEDVITSRYWCTLLYLPLPPSPLPQIRVDEMTRLTLQLLVCAWNADGKHRSFGCKKVFNVPKVDSIWERTCVHGKIRKKKVRLIGAKLLGHLCTRFYGFIGCYIKTKYFSMFFFPVNGKKNTTFCKSKKCFAHKYSMTQLNMSCCRTVIAVYI